MIVRWTSTTLSLLTAILLSSLPSSFALSPADLPPDTPVSRILSLAAASLSSGASADALAYYDIAVARDPSNYLTLFKRGATHLSLGRTPQALSDFDKVLNIKPGFEGALQQRAKIRARNADWAGARADYEAAGRDKAGEEIRELDEAEGAVKLAKDAEAKGDWEGCVSQAGGAIVIAGGALDLRNLRARCRFEKGEIREAVSDLQHAVQINAGATQPHLQISAMLFYSLGETDKGLEAVRRCLHSDPDSKTCVRLLKREKKVEKEVKKASGLMNKKTYASAAKGLIGTEEEGGVIKMIEDDIREFREQGIIHANSVDGLLITVIEMTCDCYVQMNNHKRGDTYCARLLTISPTSLPALLHQAHQQLARDEHQPAIATLQKARDHHPEAQQLLNQKLQEAQLAQKKASQKDYYKALGLARADDPSAKEIKRAYLRLSKLHHPDKATARGQDRAVAESEMAKINEAYEVLSDPELKARFDAGDDPNSQEGGQPFQGSNPFANFHGAGGQGQRVFFQHGFGGGGGGGGGGGMPNFGGFKFPM